MCSSSSPFSLLFYFLPLLSRTHDATHVVRTILTTYLQPVTGDILSYSKTARCKEKQAPLDPHPTASAQADNRLSKPTPSAFRHQAKVNATDGVAPPRIWQPRQIIYVRWEDITGNHNTREGQNTHQIEHRSAMAMPHEMVRPWTGSRMTKVLERFPSLCTEGRRSDALHLPT